MCCRADLVDLLDSTSQALGDEHQSAVNTFKATKAKVEAQAKPDAQDLAMLLFHATTVRRDGGHQIKFAQLLAIPVGCAKQYDIDVVNVPLWQ